jgi:hypothetical protein
MQTSLPTMRKSLRLALDYLQDNGYENCYFLNNEVDLLSSHAFAGLIGMFST